MADLKAKIKAAQIDLIKELGVDKLEPEKREKVIMQMGEIIQQRVIMRVIEELPDEKQDEFKEVLDKASENPQLVDDFLTKNIPGIEDMILEEIGDYKQGAVEFMNQALGDSAEEEKSSIESDETDKDKENDLNKVSPVDLPVEEADHSKEEMSEMEKEEAQQQAQILEENQVKDNDVVEEEELDLTSEVEKMKNEK